MSITAANKRILEAKRRQEILTAAKKLFYLHGFTATSVDAIAAEAGVSKGLIYHYFDNKRSLLLAFSDEVDAYMRALEQMADPYAALARFGEDFLVNDKTAFADAPPIQIMLTTFANQEFDISKYDTHNPILKDIGRDYLAGFFARGIAAGVFAPGDAAQYGDIYWSFLMGKLLPVKKGREALDPQIYVSEILSVFKKKE